MDRIGHKVDHFTDEAVALAEVAAPADALVVAIDRPMLSANRCVRSLRLGGYDGLVLTIAADDTASSRVAAFSAGADQVAAPSAGCPELAARVLALLRYHRSEVADHLRYEDLEVDPASMRARREDQELNLRGKPFSLLEFFVRNPERVHSRQDIGERVWDRNFDVFSNVIDVTVSKVRAQIDKGFQIPYLQTVIGQGYILRAD
ncbi:MAG: response regulator transcription factor [Planctomycetota bacterium]